MIAVIEALVKFGIQFDVVAMTLLKTVLTILNNIVNKIVGYICIHWPIKLYNIIYVRANKKLYKLSVHPNLTRF
jgi:hypothetical protein